MLDSGLDLDLLFFLRVSVQDLQSYVSLNFNTQSFLIKFQSSNDMMAFSLRAVVANAKILETMPLQVAIKSSHLL